MNDASEKIPDAPVEAPKGPSKPSRKVATIRDVKLHAGAGFLLRPYKPCRGTFVLETLSGMPVYLDEHSDERMTRLSKRAARHLAKTLPDLEVES